MKPIKFNWTLFFLLWPTGLALGGTLWYSLFSWPRAPIFSCLFFLLTTATSLFLSRTTEAAPKIKMGRINLLWNLAVVVVTLTGALYLWRHTSNEWIGSLWQVVSIKFLLLIILLLALLLIGLWQKRLAPPTIAGAFLLLLSANSLVFRQGYGFDVFVHAATIRAWLQQGFIAPPSLLYNGFHFIIATLTNVLPHVSLITLLQWTTPLFGSAALTALVFAPRTEKNPAILSLIILSTFSGLFTTTTPQALGHLLLLVFIFAVAQKIITHRGLILFIALGLLALHPLSGLPALAIAAYQLWSRRSGHILVLTGLAVGPAVLIKIFAHATWQWPVLTIFWNPLPLTFIPAPLMHLTYGLVRAVPLLLLCLAFIHWRQEKNLRWLGGTAVALLVAAIGLTALNIPQIISGEQNDFAQRLFLAAVFCLLPPAMLTMTDLLTKGQRWRQLALALVLILFGTAAWYTSFPAWNSMTHTKAIQSTRLDQEIVTRVDAYAGVEPYAVLADQATSAAALQKFGFLERRLPEREFYFYPLPTGGLMYTQHFFPLMQTGLDEKKLRAAAVAANVHQIFVVLKPYWGNFPERALELKNNTTDWWSVGGALIGRFTF